MTIEEMKQRKTELGYTNGQIAERTGLPLGTVQKVFSGETTRPRLATVQALTKLLEKKEQTTTYTYSAPFSPNMVREAAAVYGAETSPKADTEANRGIEQRYRESCEGKHSGEYTLADYYALPEDKRVELIDGVFYDMTAPTITHQQFNGEIHRQIANFIIDNNGSCQVLISPCDVQLDCDDRTMVEPDVLIVCDDSKLIGRCVYGAPDFVLEVISKSTKQKDYTLKLHKYQSAGVREYWIVDPEQRHVIVYFFESEEFPKILPMEGKIPVNIYNGKLLIDFDFIVGRFLRNAVRGEQNGD